MIHSFVQTTNTVSKQLDTFLLAKQRKMPEIAQYKVLESPMDKKYVVK